MRRFSVPVLLNLLVPGPGLILVGRLWLGLGIGAWFVATAELGLFGLLIAPATIPHSLSWAALACAAAAWLTGQILLIGRIRFLRSADLPRELAILRRLAERALSRKDYRTARAAIAVALSLDEADGEAQLLRNRVTSELRQSARALRT